VDPRVPIGIRDRGEVTRIAHGVETVGTADAVSDARPSEAAGVPAIARLVELIAGDFCGS